METLSRHWKSILEGAEFLSYAATVTGIVAIIFGIKEFQKSVRDSERDEHLRLMDNSVKILDDFATKIIPEMDRFKEQWVALANKKLQNYIVESLSDEAIRAVILESKLDSQGHIVFNLLEEVGVYVKYGLVVPEVLCPSLSHVLLGFCEENQDLLCEIKSNGAPFEHLEYVRRKWHGYREKG
jgi:hypothetical protein